MLEVWNNFLMCFMNASTNPVASGSSALWLGRCCIPKFWKYCWSKWESLPLNGGPLSECKISGTLYREKISENAWMLSSALVPRTTTASGYLVSPSMTTRMWSPNCVGPQWSQYTRNHGSAGAGLGFSGSLWWLSVAAWHGRQAATSLSTILSMPGNQRRCRSKRLVALMFRCPEWPRSTTQSRRLPSPPGSSELGMMIRLLCRPAVALHWAHPTLKCMA